MNVTRNAKSKWIPTVSLVYLSLPILLFLIYWIKPLISVPVIALFLFGLYQTYRNTNPFKLDVSRSGVTITIIALVVALITLSSLAPFVFVRFVVHFVRDFGAFVR